MPRFSLSPTLESAAILCGRFLLAWIFLHEALIKLNNYAGAVKYAQAFGVPGEMLPLAIATEALCGLALVLGLYTRPAAVLLAGFCLVTAVLFHTKFAEANQVLHFEKNLAMAGGLLLLAVRGAGRFSMERWMGAADTKPGA